MHFIFGHYPLFAPHTSSGISLTLPTVEGAKALAETAKAMVQAAANFILTVLLGMSGTRFEIVDAAAPQQKRLSVVVVVEVEASVHVG